MSSIPSSIRKAMNDVSGGECMISVNDFLVKAAAVALRKIPDVNSSRHSHSKVGGVQGRGKKQYSEDIHNDSSFLSFLMQQ